MIINKKYMVLLAIVTSPVNALLTVSGPITASSVTVSGNVSISSMTISSLTVTGILSLTGNASNALGTVLQTTSATSESCPQTTASTIFGQIPLETSTITLTNISNYVRVSLTGMLMASDTASGSAYLTIMRTDPRGTVDLGETAGHLGLAMATTNLTGGFSTLAVSVGISILDFPETTDPVQYAAYIRTSANGTTAKFCFESSDNILLEEIRR